VTAGIWLGHVVSAATVAAAVLGWIRWRFLDAGGRWVVASLTVSVGFIPIALWGMYQLGDTRRINEFATLLETSLFLLAFSRWQPSPSRQRAVAGLVPIYLAFWVVAQWVQGPASPFSYLSAPVAGLLRVGVAGYTLIGRVQATRERWTEHLWFWVSMAAMVISGTAVILDPVWMQVFGVRDDLVLLTFVIYVLGNLIGYLLIIRGLWILPRAPV
jgi:hypothetical protein